MLPRTEFNIAVRNWISWTLQIHSRQKVCVVLVTQTQERIIMVPMFTKHLVKPAFSARCDHSQKVKPTIIKKAVRDPFFFLFRAGHQAQRDSALSRCLTFGRKGRIIMVPSSSNR